MKLSPNFSYEELIASDIAARHGIDNKPPAEVLINLKRLAMALEDVRSLLGKPIRVNSGYRSPKVNELVGSKPTSDHLLGLAADIVCPAFGNPRKVVETIMASHVAYKQVILEFDAWTHFSIPKLGEIPKREALIIDRAGTRLFTS